MGLVLALTALARVLVAAFAAFLYSFEDDWRRRLVLALALVLA
jgi:hypothetical protein